MEIRPCERADLEEVARLRAKAFARSRRPQDTVAAYLERVFFDGPWRAADLPSLVALDKKGNVIGFAGRLVRPYMLGARPLRLVIPTQLMVDPESRGLVGISLLREVKSGPHDAAFADVANWDARQVWTRLGGLAPAALSQRWRVEIRAMPATLSLLAGGGPTRLLRAGLRVALTPLDALISSSRRRSWERLATALDAEPMGAGEFASRAEARHGQGTLTPVYSTESAAWMFEELRERSGHGAVLSFGLTAKGAPVGEYVVLVEPGGAGHVAHLRAAPGVEESVLAHLLLRAAHAGAKAVEGRLDDAATRSFGRIKAVVASPPPWTLFDSADPGARAAVEQENALLGRMEGEWWLNL